MDHFQHAMLATPANPVMGVKEYQHSVCLGVTKQITSLWLDSKHHNEDWYLGGKDAIKVRHVDVAEQALRKFVLNFEKLYGAANASFNVHLLMHLAAGVHNWGPVGNIHISI
ncbi:hypothetical protein N1851_017011 [Merluccius polli]|uniref:DUF4218 domain-containing protein n=1 Tax=Merluccius polli TaxID=89951 RepID=A0AA47MR84_MERPO|nr:hypothetical protein N1851_017011 [Merluccius polli]